MPEKVKKKALTKREKILAVCTAVFGLTTLVAIILAVMSFFAYSNPEQSVSVTKGGGIAFPDISYTSHTIFRVPKKLYEMQDIFNDTIRYTVNGFYKTYPDEKSITFDITEISDEEVLLHFFGTGVNINGEEEIVDLELTFNIKITDTQFRRNGHYFKYA